MIHVMIVEDDRVILEGISTTVPWEQYGCEVVASESTGLAAMEGLYRFNPDIVITDVFMPGIDGITFAEHAINYNPFLKVIIITGYKDMNIAQRLLKLNVSSLILKPIDFNELISALKNAILELQKEKYFAVHEESSKANFSENKYANFLQKYLSEDISLESFLDKTHVLDKKLKAFISVCSSESLLSNTKINTLNALSNRVSKALANIPNLTIFPVQKYISIFCKDNIENLGKISDEIFHKLKELSKDFSMGVSSPFFSYDCLKMAFNQAITALEHCFYSDAGYRHFYVPYNNSNPESIQNSISLLADSLYEGNELKITQAFKQCNTILSSSCTPQQAKKLLENVIFSVAANFNVPYLSLANVALEISHSNYWNKCQDIVVKYILSIKDSCQMENQFDLSLENIQEYIWLHCQEDIKLNDLATKFMYSPSHLSNLIKRETGQNFKKILTQCRIRKAKTLLLETDKKIHEIARESGFPDAHYFSATFKKAEGISISAWLKINKKNTEEK